MRSRSAGDFSGAIGTTGNHWELWSGKRGHSFGVGRFGASEKFGTKAVRRGSFRIHHDENHDS
jgi:hypothetical protein